MAAEGVTHHDDGKATTHLRLRELADGRQVAGDERVVSELPAFARHRPAVAVAAEIERHDVPPAADEKGSEASLSGAIELGAPGHERVPEDGDPDGRFFTLVDVDTKRPPIGGANVHRLRGTGAHGGGGAHSRGRIQRLSPSWAPRCAIAPRAT